MPAFWTRRIRVALVASDTSIKAALEPVKLFEGIGKGGCDIGSRFAVQPLCLDEPGTSSRIPERASQVPSGLGVVVRALPTGSVTSCNRQPSEPDVVHDHIRLRQHQIVAVACIVVAIGARHMEHAGTTEGGETVGGSSCGSQLSPGGRSAEMISDGRPDANRKVLVKCVGENLLPTAQAWGLGRPGPPVAAPGAGNRHTDLFCYLWPGQALVTKLQDLLCGRGMSGSAATHRDAGTLELLADRAPMNAQLGTDLAQGPALGVQVGCTLNVHRATVTSLSRIGSQPNRDALPGQVQKHLHPGALVRQR